MKNTAPNSDALKQKVAALPDEKAGERNNRIGTIGSRALSSQATNATASNACGAHRPASHGAINRPCAWLNAIDNRCRHYEFRPDICRSFEVGGKRCSQFRELHQIG